MTTYPKTGSGVPQYSVSTVQSLYYFLNHVNYISSGASLYKTTTLKKNYPGLDIILGFPHSLEEINLPSLALVQDPSPPEIDTFGSKYQERILPFHIDGFSGGHQVEERNKLLRDQLKDDVRNLLTDSDYIDLYLVRKNGKIDTSFIASDIEITNVSSENLPVTGPLAVDRYRFRVSFDISMVRDVKGF